jgi:DNA-binding HxlR family transcriptional regulator
VQNCTGTRALELLGERWTFLILRESMNGVRRFTDLQRNLGIARNILASRLRTLVDEGVLERRRYHADPVRYAYVPTERGRALYPAIEAILRWGGEHLADEPCDCAACARVREDGPLVAAR